MNNIVKMTMPSKKNNEQIAVGKDLIELLTGAMYVNPMSLFREYIQNAADSIDQAVATGTYEIYGTKPMVNIYADVATRTIRIRDNGMGLPKAAFARTLSAIGESKKRKTLARGFRGIGRLCGLGYCQELVFRSRYPGEQSISEMVWDGKLLRELLRNDDFNGGLSELIQECTSLSSVPGNSFPPHFFEVELRRVIRHKNDLLLNKAEIQTYLGQVAPVPFHQDFSFGAKISEELNKVGISTNLHIEIDGEVEPVTRPYRDSFEINERIADKIRQVHFFHIPGIENDCDAFGWALEHSCLGAIPRRHGIGGLRIRVGNIQIGDATLLEQHFPEQRFNSWCIGEVHVLNSGIIPNGRRDDFEINAHYANLQAHVSHFAKQFAKLCRELSADRNKLRQVRDTLHRARLLEDAFLAEHTPHIVKKAAAERIRQYTKVLEKSCHPDFVTKHDASDVLDELEELQSRICVLDKTLSNQSKHHTFKPEESQRIVEEVFSALFNLTVDPRTVAKVFNQISDHLR